MSETLLFTKTCQPRLRGPLVLRPALLSRLERGLSCPITLLSAPAGFGKTTLLGAWLDEIQTNRPDWRIAWLSLDRHDNDPQYFWTYLINALQTAVPGLGETLRTALSGPNPPPHSKVTSALINELVNLPGPLLLVLDDYHLIHADSVHQELTELLDRLPENVHLVIATREDPPLGLARRRARGELAELRASDLRFSPAEAETFLNHCLGLALTAPGLEALNQRTEGWAVGLQLAALSLRERTPAEQQAFLEDFTGDDRFIFDYLMDEVFQRLSPARQDFLLQTCLLERLCAPLCRAVTATEDSASLLNELERANLFLQPIDNRRQWYRYHPLFADLLRRRLQETRSPTEIARLYCRAAEWHEHEELLREAVTYALASGMGGIEFAACLIERHALDLFYRSEFNLIYGWLKALPETSLRRHPLLAAMYANTHVLIHMTPEAIFLADHWLEIASAGLGQSDPPVPFETEAYIAKFRAYLARFRGEPPATVIHLAQDAINRIPPGSARFYSALSFLLGMCYLDSNDEERAIPFFQEAMRSGMASDDWLNALAAVDRLSYILTRHGSLNQAAALCRQVLEQIARMPGAGTAPVIGTVLARLAAVLVEWNQLEEAGPLLERARGQLALTSLPEGLLAAYLVQARLCVARGDGLGAMQAVQQGSAIMKARGYTQEYIAPTCLLVAGLFPNQSPARQLPLKNLDSAQHPAECGPLLDRWGMDLLRDGGFEPDPATPTVDRKRLTLARWLMLRRPGLLPQHDVLSLLDHQLSAARQQRLAGVAIEILVMKALLHQANKRSLPALDALHSALALAEPEGYTRLFIEFGRDLPPLLRKLVERSTQAASSDTPEQSDITEQAAAYAALLLERFEESVSPAPASQPPVHTPPASLPSTQTGHIAPAANNLEDVGLPVAQVLLTPREIDVLRLLAEGLANKDIAARLYLSINTVRIHSSNLYAKLEVANRTQAVARARVLGYLD